MDNLTLIRVVAAVLAVVVLVILIQRRRSRDIRFSGSVRRSVQRILWNML